MTLRFVKFVVNVVFSCLPHTVDGLRHGKGYFKQANNDTYDGEWANDLRHGEGVSTYANGDSYTGSYIDGHRCGRGVFTYASAGGVYRGGTTFNDESSLVLFS